MWIVAIGWSYVVVLMAVTEPTVMAGIMTFFGYGVLPLSLLLYLASSKRKRARRAKPPQADGPAAPQEESGTGKAAGGARIGDA